MASVDLVRAIIEALNRGDVDSMLAYMDRDFEWRPLDASPIVTGIYRGHDHVRSYVEDWIGAFEDLRLDLEDPVEVGDRVIAMAHGQARGRASGVAFENTFCQVWTVRDGRAIAMDEYETREEALEAVEGG
jgi:uncharacterized protein